MTAVGSGVAVGSGALEHATVAKTTRQQRERKPHCREDMTTHQRNPLTKPKPLEGNGPNNRDTPNFRLVSPHRVDDQCEPRRADRPITGA